MKLIAIVSLSPDGIHRYKKGERFEISDASARLLIATKKAKPDIENPKSKREYLRRDMEAEK